MNGDLFPVKAAFGAYLERFYNELRADTKAIAEFKQRGFAKCFKIAPSRMVDDVESMLKSYRNDSNTRKNNSGEESFSKGSNSKFPVFLVGYAKDISPADAMFGYRVLPRRLVTLSDEPNASYYGFSQKHGDLRIQIAICAADTMTAKSLSMQLSNFASLIANRRIQVPHTFGQYEFSMPAILESADLMFSPYPSEDKSASVLITDITLKLSIPYLDAPADGEPNDGSTNNPKGYPLTQVVGIHAANTKIDREVI